MIIKKVKLSKAMAVAVGVVAGVALAATTGIATSGALFTSDVTHADNSFSTGSVILNVNNGDDTAYQPIVATNLVPGDTVYKSILVKNTGTLEFRYAVTSEVTALSAEQAGISSGTQLSKDLSTDVRKVAATADCGASGWAGGAAVANGGTLGGSSPAVGSKLNFIGDPAQGAQAGDRTVAAGQTELLCVKTHLDVNTDNISQNANVKYTLEFDAEQTANNA